MAELPFAVLLAGYMIDFHQRNTCPHCRPDGSCPRVEHAESTLREYRRRFHSRKSYRC